MRSHLLVLLFCSYLCDFAKSFRFDIRSGSRPRTGPLGAAKADRDLSDASSSQQSLRTLLAAIFACSLTAHPTTASAVTEGALPEGVDETVVTSSEANIVSESSPPQKKKYRIYLPEIKLPSVQLPDFESTARSLTSGLDGALKIPEQSEMLKSTVREQFESTEQAGVSLLGDIRTSLASIDFSSKVSSINLPATESSNLLSKFKDSFKDWKAYAAAVGVILVTDSIQAGKEAMDVAADQEAQIAKLTAQLQEAAAENVTFAELHTQSELLQRELDSIAEQFRMKCLEVEAVNASLNALAAEMTHTLTAMDEKAQTIIAESAMEKQHLEERLKAADGEIVILQEKLKERTTGKDFQNMDNDMRRELDELKEQGTVAVDALFKFLTEMELLPKKSTSKISNVKEVPELLLNARQYSPPKSKGSEMEKSFIDKVEKLNRELSETKARYTSDLAEKDKAFTKAETEWEKQRKELEKKQASHERTISKLESSLEALKNDQNNYNVRIKELEHLQKQQSTDGSTSVDVQTNGKLDAAKAMVKRLNEELRAKDLKFAQKEIEMMDSIKVLQDEVKSLKAQAAAVVVSSSKVSADSTAMHSKGKKVKTQAMKYSVDELRTMTATQLKSMKKDELLESLRGLGVSEVEGKELGAKGVTKAVILAALEDVLEAN